MKQVDDLIIENIDDMYKTLVLGRDVDSCAADLLTTPFSSSAICEPPNQLYMQSQTRHFQEFEGIRRLSSQEVRSLWFQKMVVEKE